MIVSKIKTAHAQPHILAQGGYRRWVELTVAARNPGARVDWQPAGRPLAAYVVRSMWVVSCPDCPETLIWEPGEAFYCPECQNVINGGKARAVKLPKHRKEIEALLLKRPMPANRNWRPPETLDRLRSENKLYGGLS